MKVIALNASPNKDGLTAVCAEAVLSGAQEAGAEVELVHLCHLDLQCCAACDRGWGKCRSEGRCVLDDDLEALRQRIFAADAWVLATPVYFGEPSERARVLLDRMRRCNSGPNGGQLRGKDFVGIMAAGGSGAGHGKLGEVLERIGFHIGVRIADLVNVTRRNKLYKVNTLKAVGRAIVEQPWDE